jgi:hypothetical protein
MIRPLLAMAAPFAALALAACAEAPPPPASSPEPPPPGMFGQPRERSPADDEMLALGKAEEQIDQLVARRDAPGRAKVTPSPGDAPEPEKPTAPAQPSTPAPMAEGQGDRCAVACRALASMASSADRLCRLAGETDGRCDDARSRVRGATARVGAACPQCASH